MSKLMVVVVFLCALILGTNPAQANDCISVVNNILSCKNNLLNPTPFSQGTQQCCDALRNINADSDVGRCLEQSPLGFAILPSKARLLPGICNLPGLSSLVNSIAPETETESWPLIGSRIPAKTLPKPPKAPALLPKPPKGPGFDLTKPPKAPGFDLPKPPKGPGFDLPKPPKAPGFDLPKPPKFPGFEPITIPGLLPPLPIPVPGFEPITIPGLLPPLPIPVPGLQPPLPITIPGLLPPNTIPTPPLDPGLLPPTTPEVPAAPPAVV